MTDKPDTSTEAVSRSCARLVLGSGRILDGAFQPAYVAKGMLDSADLLSTLAAERDALRAALQWIDREAAHAHPSTILAVARAALANTGGPDDTPTTSEGGE